MLPYSANERNTLILGEEIHMEQGVKSDRHELPGSMPDHYFNGCYAQLDLNVPQTFRIGAQLVGTLLLLAAAVFMIVRLCKRAHGK